VVHSCSDGKTIVVFVVEVDYSSRPCLNRIVVHIFCTRIGIRWINDERIAKMDQGLLIPRITHIGI